MMNLDPLRVILCAHTEMQKKPPEPSPRLKRCGPIPQAYHRELGATGSDRACLASPATHARMVHFPRCHFHGWGR